MIKKSFLLLCFFLFSVPAFARRYTQHNPHSKIIHYKKPLSGLYGGLSGGIVTGDGDNLTTANVDLATAAERDLITNNNLNEKIHSIISVNFGYGFVIGQRAYLGLEAFSDFRQQNSIGQASLEQQDAAGIDFLIDNKVQLQSTGVEYGFKIRPGFLFTPKTLMYLVIGFIRTKFEIDSTTVYNNRATADAGTADLNAVHTDSGIQIGIGLEYLLIPRLSLRFQYVYTGYSAINLEGAANIVGAQIGDDVSNATFVTPRNQSLMFGLEYYFT